MSGGEVHIMHKPVEIRGVATAYPPTFYELYQGCPSESREVPLYGPHRAI